ncbi:MAG TPA: T9SS type A sorting domain-containing protein [Candidatus Marinimicrobia bacterium]|nr:T9SS type A sorting domain-containing protein [Candidatus Neomarinimicrobiota bacterium]
MELSLHFRVMTAHNRKFKKHISPSEAGIYFLKIDTNAQSYVRKILLLK